jgi:hypothetical protein
MANTKKNQEILEEKVKQGANYETVEDVNKKMVEKLKIKSSETKIEPKQGNLKLIILYISIKIHFFEEVQNWAEKTNFDAKKDNFVHVKFYIFGRKTRFLLISAQINLTFFVSDGKGNDLEDWLDDFLSD